MKRYYTHILYIIVKKIDIEKKYDLHDYIMDVRSFFVGMHKAWLKGDLLKDDYFMLSRLGTQLLRNREKHIKFIL